MFVSLLSLFPHISSSSTPSPPPPPLQHLPVLIATNFIVLQWYCGLSCSSILMMPFEDNMVCFQHLCSALMPAVRQKILCCLPEFDGHFSGSVSRGPVAQGVGAQLNSIVHLCLLLLPSTEGSALSSKPCCALSFYTSFHSDHQVVVCVDCWNALWSESDSALK